MKESLIDYLTEEEIAQLKEHMGEKRFYETFYGDYEDVEDKTLDAEGQILNGDLL